MMGEFPEVKNIRKRKCVSRKERKEKGKMKKKKKKYLKTEVTRKSLQIFRQIRVPSHLAGDQEVLLRRKRRKNIQLNAVRVGG